MYGLTDQMVLFAKNKVDVNRFYMREHGIFIDDKIVPFSDFVQNSYINSDRYIAELQHRAWSIYEYAKERNLVNVFLTLTLPSNWHPMRKKSVYSDELVFNKSFSGRKYIAKFAGYKFLNADVINKIPLLKPKLIFSNIDKFSANSGSKELSRLLKKLFDSRIYKSIDKDQRCYFRVTEPHKDGTPHLHVSFFVPADKRDRFVDTIKRLFPFPQSKVVVDVVKPVSYLMKYILKTLDDLRNVDSEISHLSLWYIYHGICRFYTSRTFVSLEIYRKLKGMYTLNELRFSFDNEDLSVYINTQTFKISKIENEHGVLYAMKPILGTFKNNNYRDDMQIEDKTYFEYEFKPIEFVSKDEVRITKFIIDNKEYFMSDGVLKPFVSVPHYMSDIQFYELFKSLDIESCDLVKYGFIHNQAVDRGLIQKDKIDISLLNDDFFKPYLKIL